MALDRHLIAKTRPLANAANIVYWRDYRVTVLTDRLFRIEQNDKRKFRDDATQRVWFRDMVPVSFVKTENSTVCTIDTGACKLILRLHRYMCTVELDGKEKRITDAENLLGTYRTLDRCDGDFYDEPSTGKRTRIRLGTGVCSRSGVARFDDASSLTLGEDGEIKPVRGVGTDEYVFAYGNDYRAAVKALYLITGEVPMIPRYALGNWWSRYCAYSDKEYLRLLTRFEDANIPLAVATIDMDWHYSVDIVEELKLKSGEWGTEKYGVKGYVGWTGYTWNENLFPDYRAFLQKIKDRGLKITLNLHPADGIRWWEKQYAEMCETLGRDPESHEPVSFDIADPAFVNAYFSVLHKPYEGDGVEFWWIDWQQGEESALEGLDPLWALNHYHTLDSALNHSVPLILSRYAGVGSHRYPLGFSGDTFVTWRTLRFLPYFTSTASNVGYTWWSHDIGGHMCGKTDGELYVRFLQLGVFSPINRMHCTNAETMTKEPWVYGNGTGEIAAKYLRFRHRLIPYLYTAARRTHTEGLALVEPLYYEHDAEEAYQYRNEFYFGGQLLVAPVTERKWPDGYARLQTWLPRGTWYDLFTGDRYDAPEGDAKLTLARTLDDIPVFAKAGAIIPLGEGTKNGAANPAVLEVRVFSGNGEYTLYEDGLLEGNDGSFLTAFKACAEEGKQTLTIESQGERGVIPAGRVLSVRFFDIPEGEVAVYADGARLGLEEDTRDCVSVTFPFEAGKKYRVEVTYTPETELARLLRRTKRIMTGVEGDNERKRQEWAAMAKAESVEQFRELVEGSGLPEGAKLHLTEPIL